MILDFCCACGGVDNLHRHHLKPRARGGTDDETNIITLCDRCHAIIHDNCPDKWANRSELIKIGIERAKSEGKFTGRKKSPETLMKVNEAMELIRSGMSVESAARKVGVGTATIYRYKGKTK